MPNRIRVLLTVPHLSNTAQPFTYMMALAKYLPQDEFDLTICSLRKKGFEQAEPVLRGLGAATFVAHFRPRKPTPRWNVFEWVQFTASFLRDQGVIQQKGPFDIQHSLDFVPWPVEVHTAHRRASLYLYTQRNLNQEGSSALLRRKVRAADGAIAISQSTANMLVEHGASPENISLIYESIDLDEIQGVLNEDKSVTERYILNVGHIQRLKRQEDAIRAFGSIAGEMPDLQLWCAGGGYEADYYQELQTLVRDLKLEDRIKFLGARTDVLTLMARAQCLVHCADSEAFGRVLIEAMSVGLPVISSMAEGPSEIIKHEQNGLLVPIADVEKFAAALRTVLTNPTKAAKFSQNGRQDVETYYSAKKMAAQTADVYRQMVQHRQK